MEIIRECIFIYQTVVFYYCISYNFKLLSLCSTVVTGCVTVIFVQVLMTFGGIYVDTDMVLLRPIDRLLLQETVMGAEDVGFLSNGFIAAAPNARFLRLWYHSYRTFNDELWSEHSVRLPWKLAMKNPHLIHIEMQSINRPNCGSERKYLDTEGLYYNLTRNYAVHLWYRFYDVEHDPFSIRLLNNTIGRIFRYIYFNQPKLS